MTFNGGTTTEVQGPNYSMFAYMSYSSTQQIGGLKPDTEYYTDVEGKVKCLAMATGFLIDTLFTRMYFREAWTLSKYTGTKTNCGGFPLVCDYSVTANCTPETSPPTWNPSSIADSDPPLAAWLSPGACERIAPSTTWVCIGEPGRALKTTQTTPFACSKY